jgi:hypothetical protein
MVILNDPAKLESEGSSGGFESAAAGFSLRF